MAKDKDKGFFVASERKEKPSDNPDKVTERKKGPDNKRGVDIDKLPKFLGDGVGSVS